MSLKPKKVYLHLPIKSQNSSLSPNYWGEATFLVIFFYLCLTTNLTYSRPLILGVEFFIIKIAF